MNFKQIRVRDLLLVNHNGDVVEGNWPVNAAAFASTRPSTPPAPTSSPPPTATRCTARRSRRCDRPLDPITQDACAFFEDHAVFDDYTGVVLDVEEGKRIAHALGENKAAILVNHGLLTVGHSVDEAVWWFITMERTLPGPAHRHGRRSAQPHRATRRRG